MSKKIQPFLPLIFPDIMHSALLYPPHDQEKVSFKQLFLTQYYVISQYSTEGTLWLIIIKKKKTWVLYQLPTVDALMQLTFLTFSCNSL
jgi:hypothetical protein